LDSLRRVEHALETKLAALSAAYRGYLATGNVSASTLSHLVPGNAAAVEFVRFEKDVHSSKGVTAYLAVVLRAGVRPTVVDLGDGGPIDTAVQRYRELVDLPPSRMEDTHELDQYRAAARQLSASVWAPLVPLLDDAHLVIVAPDGSLNLVAFGTLVSEPGHYLIEEKTIHYVSALRDLVRFEQDYSPGVGLLAMGNPDFDVLSPERSVKPKAAAVEMVSRGDEREARPRCRDFAQRNWPALPATASEVRAVTAGWRQSVKEPANLLLGMQASEGRFKADAPSSRVVYFATHGYFLTDCADDLNGAIDAPLLRSGVLLAGANRHGKNAEEDGVVTAHEIATLDMEAVEAVVLSGCETGLGTVQDGEGVYGLRRAFLMAGARHVVSALWRVPDLATAVMMAGLYESNTLSLGARIRAAQLERLASLRQLGQSDHPAQWGAFIVVGDPR
jgi:CHAT domain-containing protein